MSSMTKKSSLPYRSFATRACARFWASASAISPFWAAAYSSLTTLSAVSGQVLEFDQFLLPEA